MVVLPPPDAPMRAVTLPLGIDSDTSSKITLSEYPKVKRLSSTNDAESVLEAGLRALEVTGYQLGWVRLF